MADYFFAFLFKIERSNICELINLGIHENKFAEIDLFIVEGFSIARPVLRILWTILVLFERTLVDFVGAEFFLVSVFNGFMIITIPRFGLMLDPLADLDDPHNFGTVFTFCTKLLVCHFKLGRHLTLAVYELEIIFFVWILNVDIFHTILLTLGDDFVHSHLSSFVHPNHWNADPNEKNTSDKFFKYATFFFLASYAFVSAAISGFFVIDLGKKLICLV